MFDQLPAEIRKIAEETQKIEDEIFKASSKTPEQIAEEEKAATEKKASEEAAAAAATGDAELTEEGKAEAEKKTAEEKAAKEAEEVARGGDDTDKAEHKYKVLQGKYNKELPREREARKSAEEKLVAAEFDKSVLLKQIQDLTQRLEQLEAGKVKEKVPGDSQRVTDVLAGIDDDPDVQYVKNEFPDVWKAFKKGLGKTFDKFVEGTNSKITKIEEKFKASEETTAKTKWDGFNKYLDENVEGWQEVNVDPEFRAWLIKEDKHLGIKEAIAEMNGPRVGRFFVDFAKSKEKSSVSETEDKAHEKKDETKSVTPGKGVKPTQPKRPINTKDEMITQEDIAAFYDRKRRGFYIGREAEGDAEEKRIEKAVVENRVK